MPDATPDSFATALADAALADAALADAALADAALADAALADAAKPPCCTKRRAAFSKRKWVSAFLAKVYSVSR
jgi:hypothetical protein